MTKNELMKYPKKYLVGLLTMERDDAEFENLMKKKRADYRQLLRCSFCHCGRRPIERMKGE